MWKASGTTGQMLSEFWVRISDPKPGRSSGEDLPIPFCIAVESAARRDLGRPFASERSGIIAIVGEGNEWLVPAALGGRASVRQLG